MLLLLGSRQPTSDAVYREMTTSVPSLETSRKPRLAKSMIPLQE
jgi:hypothetical protein